jgi:enterochelin esterase-like enzyme
VLPSSLLRTKVRAKLWSAAETDPGQPLPLLVVHDGPEYAEYSSLVRLLDHLVASASCLRSVSR